jgi:undecaprenyl-diphosphatase
MSLWRSTARRSSWLAEVDALDRALYAAVADARTPHLDGAMRRLSAAANYSRLSILASGVLAVAGGPRGRQAAASGLLAVSVTAATVNLLLKPIARRRRPDRDAAEVPLARLVRMPVSRSFPSGHAAAAVAFAAGAGRVLPAASVPLHTLAALVAYSRVHTGVHYPGDVLAGAVLGAVIADMTTGRLTRSWALGVPTRAPAGGSSSESAGT